MLFVFFLKFWIFDLSKEKNLVLKYERYVLFWFFLLGEFFIYNIFIVYMDLIYLLCLNDFFSVREVSSFFFR